jgi:hypothetical protein
VAKLSISRAWDETKEILARDGKLFVPVAGALVFLPQVLVGLLSGDGTEGRTLWGILTFLAALIALVGQLAIVRLALSSGLSVGDAIRHGFSRALPFLLAVLLMVIAIGLVGILVALLLSLAGIVAIDPATGDAGPRDVAIVGLILLIPLIYLAVRLLPLVAVASSEPVGPIALLKRSWALTRGHFGRLRGFILVFLIAAIVLLAAVGIVVGLVVGLLFGDPTPLSVAALVLAIVVGIAQTTVTVVYIVMIARIYSQLAGEVTVPSSGT